MIDLIKLQNLALADIAAATEALFTGGNVTTWRANMASIIARQHTAATIAGIGERSFTGRIRAWLARFTPRALPAADRNRLERSVRDQLRYLESFAADVVRGEMSEAQIKARAGLYAGAARATYSAARWGDYLLPFHPGDGGTPCLVNCRCSWDVQPGDEETLAYWRLSDVEHCEGCVSRANANPYPVRSAS